MAEMTRREAENFFELFFGGIHHIHGSIKNYGSGFCVIVSGCLSTYDYDNLTKLVFMAHHFAYRAEVSPAGIRNLRIAIHKRQRSGKVYERHPDVQSALRSFENDFLRSLT